MAIIPGRFGSSIIASSTSTKPDLPKPSVQLQSRVWQPEFSINGRTNVPNDD